MQSRPLRRLMRMMLRLVKLQSARQYANAVEIGPYAMVWGGVEMLS